MGQELGRQLRGQGRGETAMPVAASLAMPTAAAPQKADKQYVDPAAIGKRSQCGQLGVATPLAAHVAMPKAAPPSEVGVSGAEERSVLGRVKANMQVQHHPWRPL